MYGILKWNKLFPNYVWCIAFYWWHCEMKMVNLTFLDILFKSQSSCQKRAVVIEMLSNGGHPFHYILWKAKVKHFHFNYLRQKPSYMMIYKLFKWEKGRCKDLTLFKYPFIVMLPGSLDCRADGSWMGVSQCQTLYMFRLPFTSVCILGITWWVTFCTCGM